MNIVKPRQTAPANENNLRQISNQSEKRMFTLRPPARTVGGLTSRLPSLLSEDSVSFYFRNKITRKRLNFLGNIFKDHYNGDLQR
jgi:hypothetical protein